MKTNYITMFAVAAMMGCNNSTTPYTAKIDINAYASVNDYPGAAAFVIPAGTVCEVGKTVIGKVDAYTEVRCPNGHGWVLMLNDFEKIHKNDE